MCQGIRLPENLKHFRLTDWSINSLQAFKKANVLFPSAFFTSFHTVKPALAFAACDFWYHTISFFPYFLSSPNCIGRLYVRNWSWQKPHISSLHQWPPGIQRNTAAFPPPPILEKKKKISQQGLDSSLWQNWIPQKRDSSAGGTLNPAIFYSTQETPWKPLDMNWSLAAKLPSKFPPF